MISIRTLFAYGFGTAGAGGWVQWVAHVWYSPVTEVLLETLDPSKRVFRVCGGRRGGGRMKSEVWQNRESIRILPPFWAWRVRCWPCPWTHGSVRIPLLMRCTPVLAHEPSHNQPSGQAAHDAFKVESRLLERPCTGGRGCTYRSVQQSVLGTYIRTTSLFRPQPR